MIAIVIENAPLNLRGELTRWLLEPKAGVFVGNVSAMVREKIWQKVCESIGDSGALLIWTTATEQGFDMKSHGDPYRSIIDIDGLKLIKVK